MPQSISKIYVHITFSTKNRYSFIDSEIEKDLWEYLGGICKGLECNPIRIGGHKDHIHICCLLSKKITTIKLLEEIKKRVFQMDKDKGRKVQQFLLARWIWSIFCQSVRNRNGC